jgi:DNA repair exonuclease SbcCD ATPase subunit
MEAFRGASGTIRIDLDGDCVLIRGDNGSGKTTIVEGLLWLFCGELKHLNERTKGLRRTEDPIVNFYATRDTARVRLAIRLDDVIWEFERVGKMNSNSLTTWRGGIQLSESVGDDQLANLFGNFDSLGLRNAVNTWGILRQDAVRAALEAGAIMHERLGNVIGLEQVNLFADSASRLNKDLTQRLKQLNTLRSDALLKNEQTQQSLQRVRVLAESSPSTQDVIKSQVNRISESLAAELTMDVGTHFGVESFFELEVQVESLIDAVSRVLDAEQDLKRLEGANTISLRELEISLEMAEQGAEGVVSRLPIRQQLANTALQLLGPNCPVCEQTIEEDSVRRHLQEIIRNADEDRLSVRSAQQALADARAKVADAQANESRRLLAFHRLESATSALDEVASEESSWLKVNSKWIHPTSWNSFQNELFRLQNQLRQMEVEVNQSLGNRLAEAEAAARSANSYLTQVNLEYEDLQVRIRRSKTLANAAQVAAKRIVEQALTLISPSFSEVFDRLAPHPTFTQLRARQDLFYGKNQVVPEVYDPERDIVANPLLVYSEGQLNVVALSYFLGLALNSGEGSLPFMVLDDPLQAMDVISVLGFADLCRRIREQRQLIVTTHDRRFGELLLRKLTPRGLEHTVVVEFDSWTRNGLHTRSSDEQVAQVFPIRRHVNESN